MMKARLVVLGWLAAMIGGCGGMVGDPSQSETQDPEDVPQIEAPNAIAMRMSQWDVPDCSGAKTPVCVVVDTDPDDLVLFFSNWALKCAEPVIDPFWKPEYCTGDEVWQYIVIVPAAMAHPGLIDLDEAGIYVHMTTMVPECGGAIADTSQVPGTLEITSMDAQAVSASFRLEPQQGWADGSGDYTAAFCP